MAKRPPRIPGTPSPSVLYVLPSIADDLDVETKNALAIRNACAVDGRCPSCGAIGELARVEHGIYSYTFQHEHDCSALTDGDAAA